MYVRMSILLVSVFSASNSNTNISNVHFLIEHSTNLESANEAIQHLVPDLSKVNNNINMYDCVCKCT